MNLSELQDRIKQIVEMNPRKLESTVCIPNNKSGMGGTPVTNIVTAHTGIDWDTNKFFLHPEVKMYEGTNEDMRKSLKEIGGRLSEIIYYLEKGKVEDAKAKIPLAKKAIKEANYF